MFSTYAEVLRLPGAWRFSLAGFFLRMPMSMVGISLILLVKAYYGNYTIAAAVSATNVIALAIFAPVLARLVDAHGQLRIMGPCLAISSASTAGLVVAAMTQSPSWILFALSALAGATWGSPGALVRARWATAARSPKQLTSAYALEAAIDEVTYIIGPVVATVLGALIHPATGLILAAGFLFFGGIGFLGQRSSEPPVRPREPGEAKTPTALREPVIVILILIYIGFGALFGANDVAAVAFAEEHGAPAVSGVLLAVFSFGSLLSALVYGARTWHQPLWKLFAVGIVALAVGVTAFLAATDLWTLGLIMLVAGVTCAPTMTNVNMIVAKVTPANQLTEGLTWMSTALNIGLASGAALAGPVIDEGGARGGYLVTVAFAWVMVLVMLAGLARLRGGMERAEKRRAGAPRDTGSAHKC